MYGVHPALYVSGTTKNIMNKVGKASFALKEKKDEFSWVFYLDVHKKTDTKVPKTVIPHSFETVDLNIWVFSCNKHGLQCKSL